MHSLRGQLTLTNLLLFVLLLAGGGALVYWAVQDSLEDQFDAGLRVKALTVITATEQDDGRIEVQFSDRFLREFDDDVATDFFQVFDEKGRSVERSDSLHDENLPQRHGSLDDPRFWNLELDDGAPARAIGIRFRPRFEHGKDSRRDDPAHAVVVVAAHRGDLDATMAELRHILAGCGLVLLAVTALVVPLVVRRGLRPLDRMAERAAGIDANSLEARFSTGRLPLELRPIAGRLNDLLARLEASFERERRFSSDLAHEMRTPLAELRALAEVALKWPAERAATTDQTVLDIAVHMEHLVERLLALARAEDGRLAVERAEVNVAGLLESALRPLAAKIDERRLVVERNLASDETIFTDRVLFTAIVANLLANAVEYTSAGGRIHIAFAREPEGFRLQIANPAASLQREDVARMFDRFWRKEASRTGTEHAGLGLALSRSFATLLGLSLHAELDERGILTVTLSAPVNAESTGA